MSDAIPDPYCYPDTDILRNKAGILDAPELAQFETAMTMIRANEPLPGGRLDCSHYLAIHRHLFQDIYDWAGELRTVRLSKGGSMFCYPEHIANEMSRLFSKLAGRNNFQGLRNAIHPFREGNGRTQLTFLILLSENASHSIDLDKLDEKKMLAAMIESFAGNEDRLAKLIKTLLVTP